MSVVARGDGVHELRFVAVESSGHEEVLVFSNELSGGDWFGCVSCQDLPGVIDCRGSNRLINCVGTPFETVGCWSLLCSAVS